MDDLAGMRSLLMTSNVAIIQKLYHYAPEETIMLITTSLHSTMDTNFLFRNFDVIRWILDHINLDPKLLNWMFESVIMIGEYDVFPKRSNNDWMVVSKLVELGAHIITDTASKKHEFVHRGLLFMPKKIFFNYITKFGFEATTLNIKLIFTDFVDQKIRDHLYHEWKSANLLVDDVYTILSSIFHYYCEEYDDIINELITFAHNNNMLKALIFCMAGRNQIIKYISSYDFYDEMIFLGNVVRSVRYNRRMICDRNEQDLEDLLYVISIDDEARQLYEKIVDRNFMPSEIQYDEEIQDVISLMNIVQKINN